MLVNSIFMSNPNLRADIDRYLDQVKDEAFLKVVHAMLGAYVKEKIEDPIIGYDVDGKPLYASLAKEQFKKQLEGVKRGEYITIEDLEKDSETW